MKKLFFAVRTVLNNWRQFFHGALVFMSVQSFILNAFRHEGLVCLINLGCAGLFIWITNEDIRQKKAEARLARLTCMMELEAAAALATGDDAYITADAYRRAVELLIENQSKSE